MHGRTLAMDRMNASGINHERTGANNHRFRLRVKPCWLPCPLFGMTSKKERTSKSLERTKVKKAWNEPKMKEPGTNLPHASDTVFSGLRAAWFLAASPINRSLFLTLLHCPIILDEVFGGICGQLLCPHPGAMARPPWEKTSAP